MTELDTSSGAAVAAHYGRAGLIEAIDEALRQTGADPDRLAVDDLAPLDQFHTCGKVATLDLARLAQVAEGEHVLDLGGGLGGPARTLASAFRCAVTVLDLTPEYCDAGRVLTRRVGLEDRVDFRVGDALRPPFEPGSFDVVWTQHSTMNIADKPELYRQARRMLRAGGRLAMHEIVAGAGGPVHLPVPWATEPSISFLLPAAELRRVIEAAGFTADTWVDVTESTTAWARERLQGTEPPPVSLNMRQAGRPRESFENLRRNLEEQRIAVIEAVFSASPAADGAPR